MLVVLAVFSILGFDQSWDTLNYHLPYAALRVGLLSPQEFLLPTGLQSRFEGFPAFIDILQGVLWRVFGTPKAVALITPLAVACLAAYARLAFRIGLFWSVMIFLAVPILHTALNAAYVDLWTNAFFSVFLLAAFKSLQPGEPWMRRHLAAAMLALGIAVNSKEQYYILGGLAFGVYALLLALPAWQRRDWKLAGLVAALAVLAFAAPLKNLFMFGNPIYPIELPALGWHGPEQAYFPAGTSNHIPQFVRYLLSQMELDALDHRTRGYSIDQGEAEYQPGYHMGGSSGILLVVALAILWLCLRRVVLTRLDKATLGAVALLTILVACFPVPTSCATSASSRSS